MNWRKSSKRSSERKQHDLGWKWLGRTGAQRTGSRGKALDWRGMLRTAGDWQRWTGTVWRALGCRGLAVVECRGPQWHVATSSGLAVVERHEGRGAWRREWTGRNGVNRTAMHSQGAVGTWTRGER